MRRVPGLAAAVAAVLIGTAACSSDPGSSGGGEAAGEVDPGPIAEFLGLDDAAGGDGEQRYLEEERNRQEFIRQCMAEQGFEYVPVDPPEPSSSGTELDWGTREWTETYGFGLSTLMFTQESVGPDLVGVDFGTVLAEPPDPNQEAMDQMDESERAAYQDALYGGGLTYDESMTDEELQAEADTDPAGLGCEGRAYSEATSSNEEQFYTDFGDELDDLYQRVESDPRIVEAQTEVDACVGERGLDYTSEEEFTTAVLPELAEMGTSSESTDAFDEPILSDADREKLAGIQADEIELALAVEDCGGGRTMMGLAREVSAEYEQEFLDEHAGELEQYAG
ncbi:MAG: hypothetical protein ACK5RL_05090 [Acidimicrobiales bacterium]